MEISLSFVINIRPSLCATRIDVKLNFNLQPSFSVKIYVQAKSVDGPPTTFSVYICVQYCETELLQVLRSEKNRDSSCEFVQY